MHGKTKKHREYNKRCRTAISNPVLREAIERTATRFSENREKALAGMTDYEQVRDKAREIKERCIAKLDENIRLFEQKVRDAGGNFFFAADSSSACDYIISLLRERNVKSVVKSKSLVTEEIGLNSAIAKAGMRVVETDLGEWIVQLRGEKPSHLIAPAIHLTAEEIAKTFGEVEGRQLSSDPKELVNVARKRLREEFINAGAGITGANFLLSETGTLVIISNEGNARLVSSLPSLHIAVVGMEKVINNMEEAVPLIKLLTKSATGQALTSYVSFITGPSRTADIELNLTLGAHGPEEVHVVLLDNGRSKLAKDKEFSEALCCLRCGACLNVCPVFKAIGGHVFGSTYMGGIGAILTYFLEAPREARELIFSCTGCSACADVCPVKINIPELLLKLREKLADGGDLGWFKKLFFREIMTDRNRFENAMRLAALSASPFKDNENTIRHLPLFFSGMTQFRTLPAIASVSFRKRFEKIKQVGDAGEVIFFPGCLIEFVYPHIGEKIIKLLNSRGIRVAFPEGLLCCGYPLIASGDISTARQIAINNIKLLSQSSGKIITACPTCLEALSKKYSELFSSEKAPEKGIEKEAIEMIAERGIDITQYLVNDLGFKTNAKLNHTITYHDPCHMSRKLHITDEPRKIIKSFNSADFIEMDNACECCGAAGSFALEYPAAAEAILDKKLKTIEATGAELVITTCPGCIMQIQGGLKKAEKDTKVMHLIELIDQFTN